jgi:hypothetical protein
MMRMIFNALSPDFIVSRDLIELKHLSSNLAALQKSRMQPDDILTKCTTEIE